METQRPRVKQQPCFGGINTLNDKGYLEKAYVSSLQTPKLKKHVT